MIKNTILAIAAVAAMGTASTAFATEFGSEGDNAVLTDEAINLNLVQNRLEAKGLDVSSVESWGNQVRAFVVDDNGQISQHFFDRDTLAPVGARG